MSGDYTRNTFRPSKQFSSVRQQQGRVHPDADWNEAVDIALARKRTALGDVIGKSGMPEDAPGFEITALTLSGAPRLAIGWGRAYLRGLLVEHTKPEATTLKKVSGSGADTVWEVTDGPRLVTDVIVGPHDDPLSNPVTVKQVLAPQQGDGGRQRLKLSAAFGGGTKRVVVVASYSGQGHQPSALSGLADGHYLAYLDVWEREITALEDPGIREVALGGPDTALRTQVTWKVDLHPASAVSNQPVCKDFGPDWRPDPTAKQALLAARTSPTPKSPGPCVLPSEGGYRSLENRLYRVEVQVGGAINQQKVFVKWSRDNAIHRSRLLDVKDGSLIVEDSGKDDVSGFTTGDWLEVIDETRILAGEAGFFVELGEVVDTKLGIKTILDPVSLLPLIQSGKPDTAVLPKKGLARRWEGGKPVEIEDGKWLPLENGIEVQPDGGLAHVGDHWLIPARTLTADIEWPADEAGGTPAFEPPVGIVHRYCPLAIIKHQAGAWSVVADCRPVFPPLTRLESFFYLGGDGQETMPDLVGTGIGQREPLDSPLRVGVARGRTPVKGRLVRFKVTDTNKNGRLAPVSGTPPADVILSSGTELVVRTSEKGVAEAKLSVDRRRHTHHVTAELLDANLPSQADPVHLPIHFTTTTSVAAEVAYDPDDCKYQSATEISPKAATTVQTALDRLCPRIELDLVGGDGQELCVGKDAPAKLSVALHWGKVPLANQRVRFKVTKGDASVNPSVATTGPDGIAQTTLKGGSNALKDDGVVQVEAAPDGLPAPANPGKLIFTARFINARCVYVDPQVCPGGQSATGSNTVAALVDHLCKTGGQDDGIHVIKVMYSKTAGSFDPLKLDEIIPAPVLANGLRYDFDRPIAPECIKSVVAGLASRPIGTVILDLPFPVERGAIDIWWRDDLTASESAFATRATKLDGTFKLADNRVITWTPSQRAHTWLSLGFARAMKVIGQARVPAQAVLYGNRIWSPDERRLWLDGDLFADLKAPADLVFPSGDGCRGGDLILPFYVGAAVGLPNFIGLAPVLTSSFFTALNTTLIGKLSRALDAAVDRRRLAEGNLVPEDVVFDKTRKADPAEVRRQLTGFRAPGPLRVWVHSGMGGLLSEMRRSIRETSGLTVEVVVTSTADPAEGFISRLRRPDPAVDSLLVNASIFEAIRKEVSVTRKVGDPILKI